MTAVIIALTWFNDSLHDLYGAIDYASWRYDREIINDILMV